MLLLLESPRLVVQIHLGERGKVDDLSQVDSRREHAVATVDISVVGDGLRKVAARRVDLDVVVQLSTACSNGNDEVAKITLDVSATYCLSKQRIRCNFTWVAPLPKSNWGSRSFKNN